jgi:hypothetical protein
MEATGYTTIIKRTGCDTCRHKHSAGRYCHVFVAEPEQVPPQEIESHSQTHSSSRQPGSSQPSDPSQYAEGQSGWWNPPEDFTDWLDDDEDIPGKVPKVSAIEESGQALVSGVKGLLGAVKARATNLSNLAQTVKRKVSAAITGSPAAERSLGAADLNAAETGYQQGLDEWDDWGEERFQSGVQPEQAPAAAVPERQGDELNEPKWATGAGFRRCGCREGVPRTSKFYTAVPVRRSGGASASC